jgi:hypothetical protein
MTGPDLITQFFSTTAGILEHQRNQFRNQLERFSSSLASQLRVLEEERRRTDRTEASQFNVFDFIDPDENRLSDILRDLLNPNGPHGQGTLFLDQFLQCIDISVPLDVDAAKVFREDPTHLIQNPLRRIDITLDLSLAKAQLGSLTDFAIAIENKPWAGEQDKQVADYIRHLRTRHGERFVLVYLSGNGTPPRSIEDERPSLERAGRFRLMTYRPDLIRWLEACLMHCEADRMRWFLRDFTAYLEKRFLLPNPTEESDE